MNLVLKVTFDNYDEWRAEFDSHEARAEVCDESKTTVGKILAKHFGLPYFSKDGVKEPIFDHVGCPTSIENETPLSGIKMDDAAQAILIHLLKMQISANKCIFSHLVLHYVLIFQYFKEFKVYKPWHRSNLEQRL